MVSESSKKTNKFRRNAYALGPNKQTYLKMWHDDHYSCTRHTDPDEIKKQTLQIVDVFKGMTRIDF